MTALEDARAALASWEQFPEAASITRPLRALVEYAERVEADARTGQAEHARWQERAETAEAKLAENGSCWDLAPMPPIPFGECGPTPPHCILRAGHRGAHRGDRHGAGIPSEWITRDAHNTFLDRIDQLETELATARAERDEHRQQAARDLRDVGAELEPDWEYGWVSRFGNGEEYEWLDCNDEADARDQVRKFQAREDRDHRGRVEEHLTYSVRRRRVTKPGPWEEA